LFSAVVGELKIYRSTICQQEQLSHCASLSTQHVRLSVVRLRRSDSLELAAWWT